MNNILRFTLVLFLVNLIAAGILAGVYHITRPKIELEESLVKEAALKEVMPESVGNRLESIQAKGGIDCWKVFKGSSPAVRGYVFIAKEYGYSSVIESMVGMKKDGTITGVRIVSQNETPGLGAKIIEVVSNKTIFKVLKELCSGRYRAEENIPPYFTEQFRGLDIRGIELSKHGIQAITGATISSQAVVDSIRKEGLEILNVR